MTVTKVKTTGKPSGVKGLKRQLIIGVDVGTSSDHFVSVPGIAGKVDKSRHPYSGDRHKDTARPMSEEAERKQREKSFERKQRKAYEQAMKERGIA